MFDINMFKNFSHNSTRYDKRIKFLNSEGIDTNSIEETIRNSIYNIKNDNNKSFVIYGEPQSGKTEMMIALTAKLLDEGFKTIILLLNDNVQLLNQNLDRFKESGLDPTPQNYKEILDSSIDVTNLENVIFCKKNGSDLRKLIQKIGNIDNKIIIDDEADYATPNGKIKKEELTTINKLVGDLLIHNSFYIGVTATPARLDLNNTFENNSADWVDFKPHPFYTGQDIFFPTSKGETKFNLELLPDNDDSPIYLRKALFSFMVNVAFLNLYKNNNDEKKYSMLIHTSGVKADHFKDLGDIKKIFSILYNEESNKYESYVKEIWTIAYSKYNNEANNIVEYIIKNRKRNSVILINSDGEKEQIPSAVDPSSLFTISIGGNIVSRGVTFNNLLSMFFTRDVKHKIQQDTYIQRARMFGARGNILKYFDLTIPITLYKDWHRCFVYHRLALDSLKNGELVWFEDTKISSVANSSKDDTNISFSKGEMSFELFDYTTQIEDIINNNYGFDSIEKLELIKKVIGNTGVPEYLMDFINKTTYGDTKEVGLYKSLDIINRGDYVDREKIINSKKSFLADLSRDKTYGDPQHKIRIFFNSESGKARLFYKYSGVNVNFLKNTKND